MTRALRALRFASAATLGLSAFAVVFLSHGAVEPMDGEVDGGRTERETRPQKGPIKLTQRVFLDYANLRKEALPDYKSCPRFYDLLAEYKACLNEQTSVAQSPPERLWLRVRDWVEVCGARLLRHVLTARYLTNRDDIKVVLMPSSEGAPLTEVTVGIGNDTTAEERLKRLVPQTLFHGADPIKEDGAVFSSLGKYHQVAINDKPGVFNASVLRGKKYEWDLVDAVTLQSFLQDTLKVTMVDYLFLDIEGAEYRILPALSQPWTRELPICQINMELHGPLGNYSLTHARFNALVKELVGESDFVPLWVPPPLHHHRFFLLNWKHPACVTKFFHKWC